MPDGEVAVERGETALVEHLGDEAHVLDDGDELAVAHRDAGRLLAPVLQGVEAEVGEVGHRLPGGVDAEDAARVADLGLHRALQYPMGASSTPAYRVCNVTSTIGTFPSARGIASRQASVASASDTSNASDTGGRRRRSPTTEAATPDAAARSSTSSTPSAATPSTTRDADSENHVGGGRRARSTCAPRLACDRHLGDRDREAAVGAVVHAAHHSLAAPASRRARAARAAASRSTAGGRPVRSPCTRRPLRATELRRASCRAPRRARRPGAPAGGGTRVEPVDRHRRRRPRESGRCRAHATRCRSSRCRRSPGSRARGTRRSSPRRPRRTATSPRGARGFRSSGSSRAPAASRRRTRGCAPPRPPRDVHRHADRGAEARLAVGGEREAHAWCPGAAARWRRRPGRPRC